MQTKRTIIPAGTPGTFRPEWGQYPEPLTDIVVWKARNGVTYPVLRAARLMECDIAIYAWQYVPIVPPVDGLEAFKAQWRQSKEHGYRYSSVTKVLHRKGAMIDRFPTLAAAQEAAYVHFLSTLNAPDV